MNCLLYWKSFYIHSASLQAVPCGIREAIYENANSVQITDTSKVKRQLIYFLIQGRVSKPLEFDVSVIERSLPSLNISTRYLEFIEEQIGEYRVLCLYCGRQTYPTTLAIDPQ